MDAFLMYLFALHCFSTVHVQSQMEIDRDPSISLEDDFKLPRNTAECPLVGDDLSPFCSKYNALLLSGCWCKCSRISGKYTFFEPSNSCLEVRLARQRSGCDLLFAGETLGHSLSFIPPNVVTQKSINVPANKTCSFYFGKKFHAQYIGCDGAWIEIPTNSVNESLEVSSGWNTSQLQLTTKSNVQSFLQRNPGRIFRVAVQCRHQLDNSIASSTCVMFKVKGRINCPIPQQSPVNKSATLPSPTVEKASTTALPPRSTTSQAVNVTTESPAKVTTEAIIITVPGTGVKTTQQTPGITSPLEESTERGQQPTERVQADAGKRKASKKNTYIIAGAVAGGILLIALILLISWRCASSRKKDHSHRRFESSSISRPISQMSRNSIPVYTDAGHMMPAGPISSVDNPTYRRVSDGVVIGPEYPDSYPSGAPPRPPAEKRGSVNGHVNPALSLKEEVVTLNPLFEGKVMNHNDNNDLNRHDMISPERIILEECKSPEEFHETYDCPEEILDSKPIHSTPVPVYYVADVPDTENFPSHFGSGMRHVYDRPEGSLSRGGSFIVEGNPDEVVYPSEYKERPQGGEISNPYIKSGMLKVGSVSPNASYDDGRLHVI